MTRNPSSTAATLGWAAFLACSWTWCIGMFLPVLMVRDFGFMGWLVFALPNIIGAAAMGWVLARPGAAQKIVSEHAVACQCFSAVTIAFHCFFISWLVRAMLGIPGPALAVAIALAMFLVTKRGKFELPLSVGVLLISLVCFAALLIMRGIPVGVFEPAVRQGSQLAYLSPVVVFGFALCPYLDLTFLRARAMTAPKAGIAAFTIGFGFFFLLMILFTLCYSRWLLPEQIDRLPNVLAWVIGIHIIVQAALTVALHARPLAARDAYKPASIAATVGALLMFILPLFVGTSQGMEPIVAVRGEMVYRLFMGFYGLVFPAYVWLCVIPLGASHLPTKRQRHMIFAIAVMMAAPMFFLGFIASQRNLAGDNPLRSFGTMAWLLPGIAVLLLARLTLLIYSRRSPPVTAQKR
jgi:hypothetical protein